MTILIDSTVGSRKEAIWLWKIKHTAEAKGANWNATTIPIDKHIWRNSSEGGTRVENVAFKDFTEWEEEEAKKGKQDRCHFSTISLAFHLTRSSILLARGSQSNQQYYCLTFHSFVLCGDDDGAAAAAKNRFQKDLSLQYELKKKSLHFLQPARLKSHNTERESLLLMRK